MSRVPIGMVTILDENMSCCCCHVSSGDVQTATETQRKFLESLDYDIHETREIGCTPVWCSPCRKIGLEAMRQNGVNPNSSEKSRGFSRKRERLDSADAIWTAFKKVQERKIALRKREEVDKTMHKICTMCAEMKDRRGSGDCADDADVADFRRHYSHSEVAEFFTSQNMNQVSEMVWKKRLTAGESIPVASVREVVTGQSSYLTVRQKHFQEFYMVSKDQNLIICPICSRQVAVTSTSPLATLLNGIEECERIILFETVVSFVSDLQNSRNWKAELNEVYENAGIEDITELGEEGSLGSDL